MLFVPPRHGKSELVTIRYPVWRLERDPHMRVIVGAYNATLAAKFSRKARKIAAERFELSEERSAADDWETPEGGGMRAVGVGSGVTGTGGQLIIIDDPVKSRAEAESLAYREHVWDWYTDDLYTRLEPRGAMILIMTRWHEDDLAGRILASEDGPNWTVIKLPAEAEPDDPLGRQVGEALCPERYDVKALHRIRTVLGTRSYWALYQQRPQPAEGSMFKTGWFTKIDPGDVPKHFDALVRYWDKAATAGSGDYTAGVLLGRAGERYIVLDVVRGQWSTYEREVIIRETAMKDARKYGKVVQSEPDEDEPDAEPETMILDSGPDIWIEQEPGSGGKDSAAATIAHLSGFNARAERPTGDKAVRAAPFAAQAEAGNVLLVRGAWNAAYLDEMISFPTGVHDDQVDGTSGAFNKTAMSYTVEYAPSMYT